MCSEKMLPFIDILVLLWYIGLKGSDVMHPLIAQYIEKPGNTSFLLDIPGCEKIYQRCKDAEEAIGKDYREFFRCVRLALEEFVKKEELEFRIKKNPQVDPARLELEISEEFSRGENTTNRAIRRLAKENGDFEKLSVVLCDYFNLRYLYEDDILEKLESALSTLRKQGNSAAHAGIFEEDYSSSNKAIKSLFGIIAAYYGKEYKYDFDKQPFENYYPIPKKLLENYGISFSQGKRLLFKKDKNGKIDFYISIPEKPNPSVKQQHAASMLYKLWDDNPDTPDNTISRPEYKCNNDGISYCQYLIQLPGFVYPLSDKVIKELNNEEKTSIISGIVKGIATLHNFDPPLYHRAISLDSFVIYKLNNGKYKPLLVKFDCVKNTDESVEQQNKYTVFTSVKRNANAYHSVSFFAPELIKYCMSLKTSQEIDWGKADIYSLGLLIKYLDAELTSGQNEILEKMTDKEPSNRPDINTVKITFCS